MTAMTVVYASYTGHPLGALTTTVRGDALSLEGFSTLQLSVPIPDPPPPSGSDVQPPPTPLPPPPRRLTFQRGDLAIGVVDAEFDDPLEVFEWRVVTGVGPDGRERSRLDRPAAGRVKATRTSGRLTVEVPGLGTGQTLNVQIRDAVDLLRACSLKGTSSEPFTQEFDDVPGQGPVVVMVESYLPAVSSVTRADSPSEP